MSKDSLSSLVKDVKVDPAIVTVELSDGRSMAVPIAWVSNVQKAAPEHLGKWQRDGNAVVWPDANASLDLTTLVPQADRIAREDIVLYRFGAMLLVLIAGYFLFSSTVVKNLIRERSTDPKAQMEFLTDNISRSYIGAQVNLTLRRYDHASAVLLANSARNNTGFLVGTLLAFLGALIVIRRVRDTSFEATAESAETIKASLKASSPGIILATLGTAIILTTLISRDRTEVEDTGIVMPRVDTVRSTETRPVAQGAEKAIDTKALKEGNAKLKEFISQVK